MADMMDNWKEKQLWTRRGKNFLIEVSHHTVPVTVEFDDCGPHRWAVYAYIYPSHQHFARFDGSDMFQDAACAMPLHCGPSFLRQHRNDAGQITSVQVGADYNHLHDAGYTHCENGEQAYSVFRDADELFSWLERADSK